MAYCPTYTNPQVKADFNSIVEDYGGKPLSNMEFRSRKLRGERFGKDKFAMDVAYYMWDKHQGDMEQIFADKEGAKYRLSKPTELYESTEDLDLSLYHLTDAERSYLEAEATIYDPFADEERVYDTHKDRKRVTYVQNIESTPTEMSQEFLKSDRETLYQRVQTKDGLNNKQQQVSELFDSNPELANQVYEALGFGKESNLPTGDETINIYTGSNQNAELSNFAIRPFTTNVETSSGEKQYTFQSVEQGFHFYKALVANNPQVAKQILATTNGGQLKRLTNRSNLKMTPEQVKEWDDTSKSIMLNLMYDSYAQNPKAAEKLLATGNAKITHTQDNTRWKTDFPEVVMTVRDMLKEEGFSIQSQPTPQQKQQAQELYSEYLEQNPNGNIEGFKQWNNRQQQINELFESNPTLANEVYEALGYGTSIIQDNKSYYRGQIEKPTIDKNGNLVLHAKEDELYKKAGLKSKGVSMTDDLQSAIEYGNGQLDVSKNLASEENVGVDLERELDRLDENGYYLIQIPKNISNEIVKEAGEVKVIGDKIVIPKGQYKIEQVIDGVGTEITSQQKQQAQQLYSEYLDTIFPDSKVRYIVYHGTDVEGLQQFSLKYFGQKDVGDRGYGIYLSKDRDVAQGYGEHLYSVLVNIQNPYNVRFKDNDPSYLWNRIERNSYSKDIEQLEKDRGKWIERVNNGDIRYTFFEGLSKKATKKEQLEFVNDKISKRISDKQERLDELNIIGKSDGVINEDYEIVTKPEQIHILGSKQDVEGFKKFIEESSEQPIEESFDKISEKYPEIKGLLTENPVFTEDGTLLDQKSFKSSVQEAAYKIMQERVYGKELTQSDIQSINNELLKLSQSIGDMDWSLKVSSKGNYYVAGYKNRGVLFDSYYSPYAEGIFRQQESGTTIGQANLQAGTVLIDMVNGKPDTPYHEYTHHFIGWFRNTEIVQEGIKKWGSEEALVQSIGEQALKQKGEAWNWWTRFVNWMKNLFGDMTSLERQELTNILTDAFLNRIDLETGETLTSERIQELRNQLSGEYIQHQKISEQEAVENMLTEMGVEVSDNMTQQDHINNMMRLRENIAATEIDINEVSEETLKRLQLNPEIDKVKRVYANLKTGEIVAEMSTTDKVTVKKLKHTSREELRELTAKYQGDLKSEWGSRNHLTLERFTEYFISTESFSNILKNDDVGYNADLLSLKNIHKESRLNAKDSRELQLGVEDMLNWINEMQKDIDPKGKAKILTEQVLVNPKDGTAGTADLVVIFSDGSYGQLDFKTMHPNFKMWGSKTEDGPEVITHPNWIHMNRKEEFRIQLMTNNHTLEDVYGLGKRRFSRVIPIAVRLGWNAKEGVNTDNVTQLRMARSNRESQNLYGVEMLPLALGEKIGIKELDAEMNKLYDVFQNKQIELSTMSVSNPKFSLLKQEVENLDKVINSAIIRKDLYYLRKDIKRLINLYHEKFEGLKDIDSEYVDGRPNPSFLETGEITELRHMIEVYQTILATSGNYFREFKLDETNQKEFLAYTEELGELSSVLSMMDLALREKMVERSMDDIDMERLKDSLDPSFTQANFREGSEQMHAVTQKFMTEVLKANDMRRIDRQRVEKKIISAKNNFEKWASSKGMSLQEGYNSILTEKTANFASQFTHEFWEDMDKAMKTKNNKWLNENFQLREDAEEVYKTNRQNFINRGYTAEEVTRWEENNQIEDAKYNPRRWRMYYEIKDRLPTEYYTEQYGELLKPGNEPALEFYHTMLDFMKEAKSMMGIGYAEGIPYNLLPNIRADLLQQFLDYGFNFDSVKEIFTSNFNTRPDDIHFGSTMNLTRRVNPITGEFLPEVPILYTTPIRNKKGEIDNTLKSRDIAKSVLIFYDMALNYKYMTEKVEPYVEAWRDLIAIEGNRAMTEGGKNILTPTEEQHRIGGHKTRALETFNNLVDYHVYGIRIPSSGISRKQQKMIMSLKSWHAKKELAFAPIAQIGNFTQIRAGAFFTGLAGFHYTTRQFRRSSNMRMRKNELYRALVQFIEPSPGRAGIVTKNIASRKVSKIVNWDTAFWGFRKGEESVNDDVLVAMMMNYGLDENGNIRRLKRLPEGTKSLFENSRIEDGRIVIDGIIDSEGNVNYDAYTALRRLVKGVGTDIKGQPDSQNPQGINLKLWGNTMMQYKGWMPGMVYARLGDIHYSPDRQTLVEGKFRSLMSDLKSDTEKSIAGFIFTEALPRLIQFTALMPVMMVAGKGYSINKARAEIDFKKFQAKFPNDPYVKELNFDDFLDYRQGQIRSLAAELTTILSLIAMILAMSASWKDDDDPWFSQNYLTRTTFRLVHRAKREIAFMVDFNSWTNTFLQTPMPILGYITDLTKLWSSTMDQIGDDIKGKDVERDGLAGALYGRNIGGSARDKKGRFYETMRWGPLNKTFKFFETHTAHKESIY